MALKIILGLAISSLLYFLFVPSSSPAQGYPQLGELKDYTHLIRNPYEVDGLRTISDPSLEFPEDLLVEGAYIYAGGQNGKVFKIDPAHNTFKVIVQSAGLITRIIKKGDIYYFLDIGKGICVFDAQNDKLEVLISSTQYKLLDSFDLSDEGIIYFSDASSKYDLHNWPYDIYEGNPYGSLWSYNLKTKQTQLLLGQLYFANGVELSPDQSIVYVAQSGRFRVRRYYLKGEKAGNHDILIDNLPGIPDNLRFNSAGDLWIAHPLIRDWKFDYIMKSAFLRNLLGKLPLSIVITITSLNEFSGGVKVNQDGKVVEFLRVPAKRFNFITTVLEANNTLYLGTIGQTHLGMIERKIE